MNRAICFCVMSALLVSMTSRAQTFDTLTFMSYNLLYYGETTSFCDNSNNNIGSKDAYFKIITKHVNPDFLVVNEMGNSGAYLNRILSKVLNVDGVSKYNSCAIQSNGFSSIVNGMFFNKQKIGLIKRAKVVEAANGSSLVRAIDVNTFYVKDPELANGADTTYFHVAAAHLKAGSGSSDEAARELAAEALMTYLVSNAITENIFLCGDLNVYGSNEGAYQELLSSSNGVYRFFDPIDESGGWNNSSSFSAVHTQSTRSSSTNGGCFSGGGMDDRFDFILTSGAVLQDTGSMSYIEDTYQAVGQDGGHFNQALNQGSNNSAPSSVIAALYEMSDHLPVVADIKVRLHDAKPDTMDTTDTSTFIAQVRTPISKVWVQRNEIRVDCFQENAMLEFIDLSGRVIASKALRRGYQTMAITELPTGLYIVRTTSGVDQSFERIVVTR